MKNNNNKPCTGWWANKFVKQCMCVVRELSCVNVEFSTKILCVAVGTQRKTSYRTFVGQFCS